MNLDLKLDLKLDLNSDIKRSEIPNTELTNADIISSDLKVNEYFQSVELRIKFRIYIRGPVGTFQTVHDSGLSFKIGERIAEILKDEIELKKLSDYLEYYKDSYESILRGQIKQGLKESTQRIEAISKVHNTFSKIDPNKPSKPVMSVNGYRDSCLQVLDKCYNKGVLNYLISTYPEEYI